MSRLHLAGIVPVANLQTNFNLPTPECLLPIGKDFVAIQKSVIECAMAGCNTIWIVANDDLAPLVRAVVGEWIYDPVYYKRPVAFSSEKRKEIPIYYVPIHPKDRDRRDSYGWSILYGIYSAWRTANNISRWLTPDKYYISFPLGIHNIYTIREHRQQIADRSRNFFLSHKQQTVKDGLPLSFTMTGYDFQTCRRDVNKKTTREYLPPAPGEQYPSAKLPLEERWSARHFELGEVIEKTSTIEATTVEVDWFYDISEWETYCSFLNTHQGLKTPPKHLTKAHQHVKIPYTTRET
jgi:hypothetical protein